ncbi:MAG: DUF2093 domain-containing protein [Pseudomonadota bacterium]
MLNRSPSFAPLRTEARVEYLDADFQVISPGDHVVCAVTGVKIPLDALSYWSVDLQEPYASAEAGLQRVIAQREAESGGD